MLFGSVLGIDVGFSPTRRSSAVCRLDWTEHEVGYEIERFRAVEPERAQTISKLADRPLLACALDGPIRSDLEVIGRYRIAEQLLTRQLWKHIGKPGQASAPIGRQLNDHTNQCAKIVLQTGRLGQSHHEDAIHSSALVEAFPSSFLGLMIAEPQQLKARRGDRSDTFYMHLVQDGTLQRLIHRLLPGRRIARPLELVTNHDDRAALVCAISALCVVAGDFAATGDHGGWIILPPRQFIQEWAHGLLVSNATSGGYRWFETQQ